MTDLRKTCSKQQPEGWDKCTRVDGHEGPCAILPIGHKDAQDKLSEIYLDKPSTTRVWVGPDDITDRQGRNRFLTDDIVDRIIRPRPYPPGSQGYQGSLQGAQGMTNEEAAWEFYNQGAKAPQIPAEDQTKPCLYLSLDDDVLCGLWQSHTGPHISQAQRELVNYKVDTLANRPDQRWAEISADFAAQRKQADIALAIVQSQPFMWLMTGSNHPDMQAAALRPAWVAYKDAGGKSWGQR